jgi:hypothetical protein
MMFGNFGVGPDSIQGAHCGLVGRGTEATLAAEGTKATETLLRVDMYWQAYLVERPVVGGASQSANVVFGLIVGNAHIATSQQPLKPSITSKKFITTEFLNYLSRLEPFTDAEGSPHLSVVRVLLGDMDLTVAQGWESVQDAAVPICGLPIQRAGGELAPWRITTTDAALSGDLMFSSGAAATPKTVPVGTSYGNNAVTKKWHDAVSAELLVPCEVIDASGAPQTASPERRSSACLPQPACLPAMGSVNVLNLEQLLGIREALLKQLDIPKFDDRGNLTQLDGDQKTAILSHWKDQYHCRPDQLDLQLRDSWQEKAGKGKGKGKKGLEKGGRDGDQLLGPNRKRMQSGKHSRWSRHLQREFGSKRVAELVVFTGRGDPEYLGEYAQYED